jgi:uncharacterized membrane protein
MNVLADVLPFLTVFSAGIATGTWVVTQFALIPARHKLPPEASVKFHVVSGQDIDRFNPQLVLISIVSGLLILGLGLAPSATSKLCTVVGVVGMTGGAFTSMFWNMPINRKIAGWPAGPVPPEYASELQKWTVGNITRTVCGLVGFSSYVIALL